MTLDRIREEIHSAFEASRIGVSAVDRVDRAFSEGRASGLADALHIIDKALNELKAARLKAIAEGKSQA